MRGAQFVPPAEAPPNNALHDQMIGRVRNVHARAEINFPIRRQIEVNRRKDLLRLLRNGIEV